MRKRFGYIVAACLWCVMAFAQATPVEDAATAFVQRQKIGGNLTPIAMAAASKTQAYAMLVREFGETKAKTIVAGDLAYFLPKYQARWDRALAQAHAKFYSVEELNSLASQGRDSPFTPKLPERQNAVGAETELLAKPLLVELVNNALQRSFSRLKLKK